MRLEALDHLGCPVCRREIECRSVRTEGDEITEGTLTCAGCRREYPVRGGIPRLLPDDLLSGQRQTAEAFGWEWLHFVEMHDEYEAQLLDWIHPLRQEFFRDKLVLDAGCGIGRHAYFARQWGARAVFAMDLSSAVETAYEHLREFPNAHVVQADLHAPPFRSDGDVGRFDFVYSIGVLHHLPQPRAGFESIAQLVAPGGTIFAWVYGHENNGVVRQVVDPFRRIVSRRLSPALVKLLAWPLTVLLVALAKLIYRPLRSTRVFKRLPLAEYIASLADFSFRQNHSIVFDQLVAPTTHYLKRDEFARWFDDNSFEHIEVTARNENSWRGRGTRTEEPSRARH
jgi:SAM-dependent methyltransferase